MIKLEYKKIVSKFDNLELCFSRNSEISCDILKKQDLIKYYKKLKSIGFDIPNSVELFKRSIKIYVNNIIQIDFVEKSVFFSVGIYFVG